MKCLKIVLIIALFGITLRSCLLHAQAPPKRLSCEEIVGQLYIVNAQMAEQNRDLAAKLQEAQAELAKREGK